MGAPLSIGSLFAGIGGLELGLEYAGLGHTRWQVEQDDYCRRVLAKHWPRAERFNDVREVGAACLAPVDLICGGFPCQDISSAGARAGLAGKRSGLWREFARVVTEMQPKWVVVENVASGASLWVDAVVGELEQQGYEALPVPVTADALGAPYPRARVFIVARLAGADGDLQHNRSIDGEVAVPSPAAGMAPRARKATDADSPELRIERRRRRGPQGEAPPESLGYRWREAMPRVDGVVPGATRRLAQRAAGNCVVPACAEVIGWVIRELEAA